MKKRSRTQFSARKEKEKSFTKSRIAQIEKRGVYSCANVQLTSKYLCNANYIYWSYTGGAAPIGGLRYYCCQVQP